jgi:hypothetical protein
VWGKGAVGSSPLAGPPHSFTPSPPRVVVVLVLLVLCVCFPRVSLCVGKGPVGSFAVPPHSFTPSPPPHTAHFARASPRPPATNHSRFLLPLQASRARPSSLGARRAKRGRSTSSARTACLAWATRMRRVSATVRLASGWAAGAVAGLFLPFLPPAAPACSPAAGLFGRPPPFALAPALPPPDSVLC